MKIQLFNHHHQCYMTKMKINVFFSHYLKIIIIITDNDDDNDASSVKEIETKYKWGEKVQTKRKRENLKLFPFNHPLKIDFIIRVNSFCCFDIGGIQKKFIFISKQYSGFVLGKKKIDFLFFLAGFR